MINPPEYADGRAICGVGVGVGVGVGGIVMTVGVGCGRARRVRSKWRSIFGRLSKTNVSNSTALTPSMVKVMISSL